MDENANLNQVRERVRQLAREIEELAGASVPDEVFYTEFLRRIVLAMGAQAGVIWLLEENRQIRLAYELNLEETKFLENQQAGQQNSPLLNEILSTGQCRLYGSGENPQFPPPTPHLHVLGPILRDKACIGVVQVFQRPDAPPQARAGYLQFLEQMCGHAARYLRLRQEAATEMSPQEFMRRFQEFTLDLSRNLELKEVASTAANDGRLLIKCDRVAIAVQRGTKTDVMAISGQDQVNARANLIRTLRTLTKRVIATKEPLLYTGSMETYPPQIEQPLADYVHESGARCVIIVPLFPPKQPREILKEEKSGKPEQAPEKTQKPIGALIVEQITDSRPRSGMMDKIRLVAEHSASALSNSLTHETLFLLPLWRTLGRGWEALRGRTLTKVLAGVAAFIVVVALLIWMQWDYRVEAKGRLMPVVQREVFSTWDGRVVKVLVESGESVKAGQPVVQLENEEMRTKLQAAENDFNEKNRQVGSLKAQKAYGQTTGNREEVTKLEGQVNQAELEAKGAKLQYELLRKMVDDLTIRSPIDGVIATFDVEKVLLYRPTQRGEVLLQVMDVTQNWHMELEVPEHRLGHMLKAQKRINSEHLPLDFLLATDTSKTYKGTLQEIATRANPAQEQQYVVEVRAKMSDEAVENLKGQFRIGAEVRAKINCGKYSLFYVLFGDVVEFIQKRLWF
ncbi:MAG: HlyD family efflux transporter periplasmic adaptor subunit [Planctomycetaceae bacterium]|nr:HlyD family efflux transporter periplasmic adaptor subunit [Planctomycetaceae bacterium]